MKNTILKKNFRKKAKALIAVCSLAAICACGSTFAWLSDTDDRAEMNLKFKKVDIILQGTECFNKDEDDGSVLTTTIVPNKKYSIAPKISVTDDSSDAICFIEWTVPYTTLDGMEEDGKINDDYTGPIFDIPTSGLENWRFMGEELVYSEEEGHTDEILYSRRLYGNTTAVAMINGTYNAGTGDLFHGEGLKVKNFVAYGDDERLDREYNVKMKAMGIQMKEVSTLATRDTGAELYRVYKLLISNDPSLDFIECDIEEA